MGAGEVPAEGRRSADLRSENCRRLRAGKKAGLRPEKANHRWISRIRAESGVSAPKAAVLRGEAAALLRAYGAALRRSPATKI
jgi:hypothetical protein